jgi:outer membrane lipoprotein LolB
VNLAARLAALLVALWLTACAVVPQSSGVLPGDALSGRLALHIDGADGVASRSVSATFDLQGSAQSGRLNLSTPLGSVLAQARWSPGSVVLATPQGEKKFSDLDSLTREVLGESLPVAALFDWLRGRPWPGAASTPSVAPAEPGFVQLGWVVSLAHFDDDWIAARRERAPLVSVRAKMDRP